MRARRAIISRSRCQQELDGRPQVPPLRRLRRLYRGLGPLCRAARPGDGLLPGSLFGVRPPLARAVARGPAGHRHRPPRQALEPRAGDPIFPGQFAAVRARHRQGGRALHQQSRPGDELQDRPAQDRRASRARRERALGDRFDIRDFHAAVLENGALPLDVLESRSTPISRRRGPDAVVGSLSDLPTPALLLDLAKLDRNIERMRSQLTERRAWRRPAAPPQDGQVGRGRPSHPRRQQRADHRLDAA